MIGEYCEIQCMIGLKIHFDLGPLCGQSVRPPFT